MKLDKLEVADNSIGHDTIISQILSEKHYAELLNSGLNDENIIDTKCFTVDSKSRCKKLTGYNLTGLIIPYLDPTGKPYTIGNGSPFYRLKPDWSFMANPEEYPKYLSPKHEGNRPYFAPTYKQWDKVLRFNKVPIHLPEGEKKAGLLGALSYAAIGLPGVYGFVDRTDRNEELEFDAPFKQEDNEDREKKPEQLENSHILPELETIGGDHFWRNRIVYIPFDSDIVQKWQVKNALKKLAEWLQSKGAEVYIVLIPSELNGDKNGVDDFIVRHGVEAYEKLLKAAEPAFIWKKKKPIFNLPTDPELFQKASLLWCVLKEHWRYRPGIGWHQWLGDRWELTDDGASTYIDDDIYQFLAANEWKAQGNGSMANLLRHMKAKLMVKHWNPKNKIAFSNGVLDIDTKIFAEGHRREDFVTVALPYPYNPNSQCPTWERFIGEALKGDPKAIDLVQAFFRWALLPKAEGKLDLEIGWDLYGRAGTGKGTVLETLKNIIGLHNCGNFTSKSIGNPNILAGLLDKRVSISPDDSGHLEDFGLYGSIISNETVLVKLLYKNFFPTTLNTFMVRAYNNVITTPSGAKGLDRRIVAMTFDKQPEVMDTDLQDKINRELSGVFNWAWNISNAEMKRRILWAGEVKAVVDASTEVFLANNHVLTFLQEKYPGGEDEVGSRDLYFKYTQWYQGNDKNRLGHRKFCDAIRNYGCFQKTKSQGISPYHIPAMGNINILQQFGILRGKTKSTQDEATAETSESGAKGAKGAKQKSGDLEFCPEKNLDSESDRGMSEGERAKGAKLSTEDLSTIILEKSDTTNNNVTKKSITSDPPKLTLIESEILPCKNPKGVITYQAYIMGKIGNVKLNFDKQGLAKEWLEAIETIFNYRGTLAKLKTPVGRYKWQIVYTDFDRDALQRLEAKDLSQSPYNR
jgi:putative DNA primase/helicase